MQIKKASWLQLTRMLFSINHLLLEKGNAQPDDIILAVPDKSLQYTKYSYRDINIAATLLAKHYVDYNLLSARRPGDFATRMTVGFLSHSDFDYVINELALSRLGYCVLLVSPNNSPAAIAHLLLQTHSEAIVVSQQLLDLVNEAVRSPQLGKRAPEVILQPPSNIYDALARSRNQGVQWTYPLNFQLEADLPFVIIHSSGSTGFPKPIVITHKSGLNNYSQATGYSAFSTLPLYHNHGHSNLYRALCSSKLLYLFPPRIIPPTNSNIISLLRSPQCHAEAVYTVPLILCILETSQQGVDALMKMKLVMAAGSALPDEVGDRLVKQEVKLVVQMGSTETGILGTSIRDYETDKEWCYSRAAPSARKFLRFEDQGEGKYELVVLNGYPTLNTSNQPDGSYRTKDLYHLHPSLECAFKFCGRLDDTLVMINGEKTNPVPIELNLKGSSPHIDEVILFGSNRSQIGALILPSPLTKDKSPLEFLQLIAPVLKAANQDAPTHSQLSPEAIIVLSSQSKQRIPRADKGSIIRAKVYKEFGKEIEELYNRLEGGRASGEGEGDSPVIVIKDLKDGERVVWECLKETLGERANGLDEETDLFMWGLDSLQATRIRNAIHRRVDLEDHKLSANLVFEHPNIQELSKHLLNISLKLDRDSPSLPYPDYTTEMLNIVDHFKTMLHNIRSEEPRHKSSGSERTMVLTGSTGSLGAYILHALLVSQTYTRIYCLARGTSHSDARNRVMQSLRTKGLDAPLESHSNRLVCFAADFSKEKLGLNDGEYDQLRDGLEVVVHCAWPVNFNLSTGSFIPHIQGALHLMNLALDTTSPASSRFYFCSSLSAVIGWDRPGNILEVITDNPAYAQQMGYARSKWIVEKLCQIASTEITPRLEARVLRIGQLAGDSKKGLWNESEAISLIFKSAQTLGVLPMLEESVSWLPVDLAAQAIHDLTTHSNNVSAAGTSQIHDDNDSLCFHVVQPYLTSWSKILDYLENNGLKFQRVSRLNWLDSLRKSDPDPIRNPTIKLLTFFEKKYGSENSIHVERPTLDIEKARKYSPTLRELKPIHEQLVGRWLESWRRSGFLS